MPDWFVVRCATRQEKRAEEGLKEAGFEAYCPRALVWSFLQKTTVERPLIPGYLFVSLQAATDDEFAAVLGIDGVHAFLGVGKPVRVSAREIEALKRAQAAGDFNQTDPAAPTKFKPGDQARVVAGTYQGLIVAITRADRKGKVGIALEMFGRLINGEIPTDQLQAMDAA